MDPPWKVRLGLQYPTLDNELIWSIPVSKLQSSGYLFLWVVNSKEKEARSWIEESLKYTIVDTIVWVKQSKNGKLMRGSGFTLRHSKEICLVARKGDCRAFS